LGLPEQRGGESGLTDSCRKKFILLMQLIYVSLFAFAFFKEAAAIADPILDPLDSLLEDPQLARLFEFATKNGDFWDELAAERLK